MIKILAALMLHALPGHLEAASAKQGPFSIIIFILLARLTIFPQLALWLPGQMG